MVPLATEVRCRYTLHTTGSQVLLTIHVSWCTVSAAVAWSFVVVASASRSVNTVEVLLAGRYSNASNCLQKWYVPSSMLTATHPTSAIFCQTAWPQRKAQLSLTAHGTLVLLYCVISLHSRLSIFVKDVHSTFREYAPDARLRCYQWHPTISYSMQL